LNDDDRLLINAAAVSKPAALVRRVNEARRTPTAAGAFRSTMERVR
jgi:hypothetical protein